VPGTRPTAERTREALFSIWQERLPGARFLDLFCGSGAAGLEALSRGAAQATLIDSEARSLAVAARNRDRLKATACRTLRSTLPAGLARAPIGDDEFDLIFADPPYEFDEWPALLAAIAPKLRQDGEAAIEHSARAELPAANAGLERVDTRRYGDTAVSFYRRVTGRAGTTPLRGTSADRRS
jgi:16S rRNA (guanine(966)-N(2))-methyltransferase RsmD